MAQTTIQGSFLGDATVTGAKIGADFISAQTALTSGLATADELIVSDAGVIKKMAMSVWAAATITFTNKSIDLGTNTLTGSVAEFNTALQSESFATLGGTEILVAKTLTTPTIASTGWTNATHAHGANNTGGTLDASVLGAGTLPAARIAVDSIVEGKLNVSNGPTNGYVLTARDGVAGGFTWEAAAAGGTTVNGTTDNAILTYINSSSEFTAESTLTYTGTAMMVGLAASPPAPDHVSMHIWEGNAGSVTASTDTQLIVEHSGNAGITVLSPANAIGQIALGSPTDNRQGGMAYNHDQNCMYLRAGNADRMRIIGSTGQIFINESTNAGNGDATEEPMLTVKMKDSNSTGEILGLKHPSHSQTITSYAEADTFIALRRSGVYGQIGMMGMNGKTGGMILSTCTQPSYTTNSSQYGVFRVMVATGSGNGQGSATAALSAYNGESNNNMVTFDDNTSTRFIFQAQGRGFADDDWTTYSDGRLKSNQEVVPYGLAEVLQLQPKVYDRDSGYIDENTKEIVLEGNIRRQIGFVAQEVRAIIPEVVEEVDELSWYSLTDGKLMAVVVKAIQELKAEVDALKA